MPGLGSSAGSKFKMGLFQLEPPRINLPLLSQMVALSHGPNLGLNLTQRSEVLVPKQGTRLYPPETEGNI